MPKVTDLKAYFAELAAKNGLGDDIAKQFEALLGDDKVAKAFNNGFKPLPDYSHDLDDVRNRTKQEKDSEYKTWYEGEQEKYKQYLAGLEKLQQYEQSFGPLDGNQNFNPNPGNGNNGNGNPANGGDVSKYLTREELQAILSDNLGRRDVTYLDS